MIYLGDSAVNKAKGIFLKIFSPFISSLKGGDFSASMLNGTGDGQSVSLVSQEKVLYSA